VDPVPDPLLLRKSSSVGNRTRTSGSACSTTKVIRSTVPRNNSSRCLFYILYIFPLHVRPLLLNPQKFALPLPTSGGRSVGIFRSRTQATEFVWFFCLFVRCSVEDLALPVELHIGS
jgi:hypothetical protein